MKMGKKFISILLFVLLFFGLFQIQVNAASVPLGSFDVTVSKEKIAPGEEVTVNVNFGTDLGAYTVDVAYDNNIFEYVKSEGGTENDDGTRVRLVYYDSSGGSNPRTNMSVTFKAKSSIVSTNPTDFSVTAEGMANADASQDYDDIAVPVKKSVTVEPNYVDYTIDFNYSGNILVDEEKEMELITKSSMGKNYDHVKMTVEVTKKPSDTATVSMLATTRTRQEVDLIRDGWGEPDGYALGGKDVEQILDVRALFSEVGEYTIKVTLSDKDSGDALIQTKDFTFNVTEKTTTPPTTDEDNEQTGNGTGNNNVGNNNEGTNNPENNNQTNTSGNNENKEELPETLPKTGTTQYIYVITAIAVLGATYIAVKNIKEDKKQNK